MLIFTSRVRLFSLSCVLFAGLHPAFAAPPSHLKLIAQPGYLAQIPVLVRVEVRDATEARDWSLWNSEALLTVDDPGVSLSTNRIRLYNGLGTALVGFSGGTNFTLTASVGSMQDAREMHSLSNAPVTTIGGTLPGSSTLWSGIIRVTNDLTIPAGHVLTIESNTLVLINGVTSGTSAADLLVVGAIRSLGTEDHPINITCVATNQNWGQIRHNASAESLYRYTSITRAGRAAGEGHTGTGPAIRPSNSRIRFESCNITDISVGRTTNTIGKIMFGNGGANASLVFDDCVLARGRMGPEISGTAVLCTNTYILEMFGPDDADGIYLHGQNAGQAMTLTHCVVANGQDDGIDTLGSTVTVQSCIVRDWKNPNEDAKGLTIFSGETRIWNCLVVDCAIAVSSKSSGTDTVTTRINRSTILGMDRAVAAENKGGGAPDATVFYFITNSILRASGETTNSVYTDYDPADIRIFYSNIGESWPGAGNFDADPAFIDAGTNFHLQASSTSIDAGDPASPSDPDGTRADVGVYPYFQLPPSLSAPEWISENLFRFSISGRSNNVYSVESQDVSGVWNWFQTVTNLNGTAVVEDSRAPGDPGRFYRVQLQR